MTDSRPVSDFTENELIARISKFLAQTTDVELGPGDDCAIVRFDDRRALMTTDVLVEGRHFRLDWISARDLGRRAIAQNLADVAAMGARPTAVIVALTIPGDVSIGWLEDLAAGMGAETAAAGAAVTGGDLVRGPAVSIAVTAAGTMDGATPVLRSGARPGDTLAHAGNVGWGAAGFALLEAGQREGELVAAHLVPQPPLAAGIAAQRAGATAMLDVSDGLLRDAQRIAAASHVVLDIEEAAIGKWEKPLRSAAAQVGVDPRTWVLGGGEDHGLLATFPPEAKLPAPFTKIGEVGSTSGEPEVLIAGRPAQVPPGWDHFAG
ncbi:MAG TPA: thiamine-phosphate kinase [Actinomycetales bacterium]|nr:thiamine-phosphate kinase [Actinomycetales bacterium]